MCSGEISGLTGGSESLPKADYYRPNEQSRGSASPETHVKNAERDQRRDQSLSGSQSRNRQHRRRSQSPAREHVDLARQHRHDSASSYSDQRQFGKDRRIPRFSDGRKRQRLNNSRSSGQDHFSPTVGLCSANALSQTGDSRLPSVFNDVRTAGKIELSSSESADTVVTVPDLNDHFGGDFDHRPLNGSEKDELCAPGMHALVDIVHIDGNATELHMTIVDKLGRVWQRIV